jgi:hypothetical protein
MNKRIDILAHRMIHFAVSKENGHGCIIWAGANALQDKRFSRWLVVAILCLLFLQPVFLRAQSRTPQASPKVMEVLNTAPLDIKDEDTQLIKLKKMRFNAAIAEANERYTLFKKGQTKFTDLVEVGQRVLTAQADLALSPEERAQVLNKQLEVFAEAEDSLDKQIKDGKGLAADLDRLRYERFGVEIDLEILRRGISQ